MCSSFPEFDQDFLRQWKWSKFLHLSIQTFSKVQPSVYPIPEEFLYKTAVFGSKSRPCNAKTTTWSCRSKQHRHIRAACIDAGASASVFNFLVIPSYGYDLPFFGADLVTLPSGHLLALDLQPALKTDKLHTERIWDRLIPLHASWQTLLPSGGDIPHEAKQYFSPGFLWTRLPLGPVGDDLISKVIFPAYQQYLQLFMELSIEAKKVSDGRSKLLVDGQRRYLRFRAQKDPARGMLQRFYGPQWTESYIKNVLFTL